MIATPRRHLRPTIVARPIIVVAIPARDEAERIAACLEALDRQTILPDAVVLLANNCTDDTVAVARGLSPRYALDAIAVDLPPQEAGAGHARRLAMQHAAERAGEGGILLTTDADGTVPPDWIQRNLAALVAGADLVCGQSLVEAVEAKFIPQHLHDDDVLERRLAALIDQMAWIIDPDPADPLPRHQEDAGASLGVWVSAWRRGAASRWLPPARTAASSPRCAGSMLGFVMIPISS
ncbi:MAG: glycosyltransferase family 2 protein [Rhodopila sp.]